MSGAKSFAYYNLVMVRNTSEVSGLRRQVLFFFMLCLFNLSRVVPLSFRRGGWGVKDHC